MQVPIMTSIFDMATLFDFMSEYIYHVIFILAAIEVYLTASVYFMIRRQGTRLSDATENLIKGFHDAPDVDSTLKLTEKVESSLRFITNKIQVDPEAKEVIRANAGKLTERSADNRYFGIEISASIMSTLVQVFPLLGILGTILSIAGTTVGSDTIDSSQLTTAFVLAMNTTILGIGFSILFMVVESIMFPQIERIITDSKNYKDVVTSVYLQ
jgi:biopolymer transport protein ExbB/TolQ